MRILRHERTTDMNTKSQRRTVLSVAMTLLVAFGALADGGDPVYITGAEYTIDGDRLTVTSGEGTLVLQTPSTVSIICVTNAASLKIGIDDPFGIMPCLNLYGCTNGTDGCDFATFDLNGHSVTVRQCDNRWLNAVHPGPGRVINTSQNEATFTVTGTYASYFYGNFEEAPGKINVVVDNSNNNVFYVSPTMSPTPASSMSVRGSTQLQILDRPMQVMFVFDPPVGSVNGAVRLAELAPTFKGVPVGISRIDVSSNSSLAQYNDPSRLTDGRSDTAWGTTVTVPHTVKFTVADYAAVDGYRIAQFGPVSSANEYLPSGWKVYVYRHPNIGWTLVDGRNGDGVPWYTNVSQSSTTNIIFSANSRMGSLLGENTAVTLENTAVPNVRLSGVETESATSLSGTASKAVRIEDGGEFAVADLSGYSGVFTANGTTRASQGRLTLVAGVNAEHPVSVATPQNIAIVNGGTDAVSVLLDDTRTEHFFGQMKDGENGRLGLVKRGAGERVIETEGAAFTGETVVHEGTLTVARRRASVTARYIRFAPIKTFGADGYGYYWGANEFEILDENGVAVAWPSGTAAIKPDGTKAEHASNRISRLIDGDNTTQMLMPNYSDGSKALPPVTIDTKTGVTFSQYRWWTVGAQKNRVVTEWRVEVSDDNVNWSMCDSALADTSDWENGTPSERGPFVLKGCAQSSGTALYTLDSRYFADGSARDTRRALKARYFRLHVYETQNPNASSSAYGWQMAEFSLWKGGVRLQWPITTAEPTLAGSTLVTSHNSRLTNLVNNVIWAEGGGRVGDGAPEPERTFVSTLPSHVTIDAGREIEFDAYSFTTTGNPGNQNDRLPKAWKLEISEDGEEFVGVDDVGNYTVPAPVLAEAYQTVGPFDVALKFPYLATSAADSIGDKSAVVIDGGATLKLAVDYEKFGPLSGAGLLTLHQTAVGEINACVPATFSGSVSGNGTLAVCGDSVQAFDGATLAGVKSLELNGGAIAGSASFGGSDVTVSFNGGATGAMLSGIGTLTVAGDVKYAVPDVSGIGSYSAALFTAASIPAESKALLSAGKFAGAVRGWEWSVAVTDTTVTLCGHKRGIIIMVY